MRIKIVGENDCARATRHLLRKAGFAVTEFLPAEVVTQGPHAGYLITVELAPATPDLPASEPGFPQQDPLTDSKEASDGSFATSDASSPVTEQQETEVRATCTPIRFDSVDGALEAAILRHVTQLSAVPVVVDRPGGMVHSERELRVIVPRALTARKHVPRLLVAGDSLPRPLAVGDHADPAAAAAVEFGVLRGLLDLLQPPAQGTQAPAPPPAPRKWWKLFAAVLALAGTLRAAPPSPVPAAAPASVELRGTSADGGFLALSVAPGTLFPQLQGASGQIFSSVYDAGNTALKVNCVVGCSATSGFSDNGTFTAGSTAVNNISAVFNDSIPALGSGNAGALRATSDRMLYVNVGKLGGTALSGANVVDSGNTAFRVNCVVGCSASAGFSDNSAFAAGTTAESNIGGVYNDGLAAVTSGNAAAARITASRALHVNLRNATGTEIGTSGTPVRVDPTGTTAQPVSGTVTVTQGTASNLKVDLSGTGANTTALKVDGSAVTQPVSGTVTANAGSGTFAVSGTVTANAGTGTFTVGQATGTNLHMVCDSGCTPGGSFSDNSAFTAGSTAINITGGWYSTSPTNCTSGDACAPQLTQDRKLFVQDFQGTSPWVVTNGGTFAVQAAQSGSWTVTANAGTGNFAANIAQVGGSAVGNSNPLFVRVTDGTNNMPTGDSSARTIHVTTDNSSQAVTQSGTWTVQPGNTQNTTPWLVRRNDGTNSELLDPCQTVAKTSTPISQTASAQIIAGTSAKKTYFCSIFIISATAQNVNIVEGTGTVCATSIAGITGGTTAATGPNLAANSGWTLGNGGATVASGATNANNICLLQSGSGQLSGVVTWVQR
jgi:hypothetical protein